MIARTKGMFAHAEKGASLDIPPPAREAPSEAPPPPPGFEPLDPGPGFGVFFGPMHYDPERRRLGFRVAPRHINLFGVCHGGALAMFADYQLVPLRRAGIVKGPFAPTLSLSLDFLKRRAAERLDRGGGDAGSRHRPLSVHASGPHQRRRRGGALDGDLCDDAIG